jgi:uncharacterized repeat protein (TIGR03803 family)
VNSALILDNAGNIYGTTAYGGTNDAGTAFELSPASGGGWNETVIYNFGVTINGLPQGLVFDKQGHLYGTTFGEFGIVFELTPSNGQWTGTMLYQFGGYNGYYPNGGLIMDGKGMLYGTVNTGGDYGHGTVFRLAHSKNGWVEVTLFYFTGGRTGGHPSAGLTLGKKGVLYGTTAGGGSYGAGTIFRLTPTKRGEWTNTLLHSFTGANDGGAPESPVTLDSSGDLYTTTVFGGYYEQGTVLRLTPQNNGKWKETVLHDFTGGDDGGDPVGALILLNGNLYGTTNAGGTNKYGTAFELVP